METDHSAAQRPRILVVEPNRSNLGVIIRRLVEHGYRVTTADCARAAIAELYRGPIELVLAELDLPRIGGAELARMIRGEIRWNDIPIVLITGKSRPADAVQAYSSGADDVIAKPFHFDLLLARIDRRISGARSVSLLKRSNAILDARLVERAIQIGELRAQLEEERLRGSLTL